MKKTLLLFSFCASMLGFKAAAQETTINIFDEILFYDGYAQTVTEPVPMGVIRHRNDSYAVKLTAEQIASIGNTLTMNVTIKAACDNYDRIGKVNLAFVDKDATSYVYNEVERIELGRYITPFMNKNVQPDEVPYTYQIDNVTKILHDTSITAEKDIWVELEVFGVPYAAQTQVAGCAGRIDVFYGTLDFVTGSTVDTEEEPSYLQPLLANFQLKNYDANGTDEIGTTTKTVTFTLENAVPDAKLYLITSNHGYNEEFERRWHYVYFDDVEELEYRPGGKSCEPYRMYNTQGNGIYGPNPRPLSVWLSFNNWCPGDAIPIRTIDLGDLEAGEHTFKIDVPTAEFEAPDGQEKGYFPVSAYLQGYESLLGTKNITAINFSIAPNPVTDVATITANGQEIQSVSVINTLGQTVWNGTTTKVDLSALKSGVYMVNVAFANGQTATKKVVKN